MTPESCPLCNGELDYDDGVIDIGPIVPGYPWSGRTRARPPSWDCPECEIRTVDGDEWATFGGRAINVKEGAAR